MRLRLVGTTLAVLAIAAQGAWGFGTVRGLGQNA